MRMKSVGAVSALALFAGLSTAAIAQGPGGGQPQGEERMQRQGQDVAPGQRQGTPDQNGAQQRRGGEAQPQDRGQGQMQRQQAQEPDGKQPRRAEQPDRKQPKQAEQPDREQSKRAEQPDRKQPKEAEQPDRDQPKRAEQPDRKQPKQAEQPDREQPKRAEQPDRNQPKQAEQPDRDQPKRAEQPDRKQQQAERPERQQLSEQQRTTVRERLRQSGEFDRARVGNVNFNISVGTRVPRDRVRLAPLPAVIVEEVPQYRGYRYFVAHDEVVIVQPDTYVIVDVIRLDGAPGRTAQAGQATQGARTLTLTSEQRNIVLSHVDLNSDVRLGIGSIRVGMDVPRNVELHRFPQVVVHDVPELSSYRYFVIERDVAIVAPNERRVVLTIEQ